MKGSLVPREEQKGEPWRKVAGIFQLDREESTYLKKKDKGWGNQKRGSEKSL